PQSKTIIDLRLGYQVILKESKSIEIRDFKSNYNPFLSIICSWMDFDNIMSQKHNYWKIYPNIISEDKTHLWIQFIHQNNKLNQKLKALKKVKRIQISDFGVEIPNTNQSHFSITLYNIMMMPYRLYWDLKKVFK